MPKPNNSLKIILQL